MVNNGDFGFVPIPQIMKIGEAWFEENRMSPPLKIRRSRSRLALSKSLTQSLWDHLHLFLTTVNLLSIDDLRSSNANYTWVVLKQPQCLPDGLEQCLFYLCFWLKQVRRVFFENTNTCCMNVRWKDGILQVGQWYCCQYFKPHYMSLPYSLLRG